MSIEVSRLNGYVPLFESSRNYLEKREELADAAQTLAVVVDDLAEGWASLGLSDREAEVAAYRQLGFTNKATAYMLELSPNTVNEYTRRVNDKIAEARALIRHVDRTAAFDKHWECGMCGENIQRANGRIEADLDEKKIHYSCTTSGCWEKYTRPIFDAPAFE